MIKKAFVTGGAGFIGSNLVRLLVQNSIEVTVYDNLSTGYESNILNLPNVKLVKGDILNREKLIEASISHDVIFHFAANIGNIKSINDPNNDSIINIIGTLNSLEACKRNNINAFVYSSSAAIFGELKYQPINESHPLEPDSPYGVSKLAAEKHCLWFGRHYGIRVVVLRYFNVYGINQRYDLYGNVIPIWGDLLLRHKPIYIYDDGDQTRDFVNVEDVAMANFLVAVNSDIQGQYNIGSGKAITINYLADVMFAKFNLKSERIYRPKRLGEIRNCEADISKAIRDFNFSPKINLELGIEKYSKWLTTEMKL
jgi:UDP-glucose 4-epimerase